MTATFMQLSTSLFSVWNWLFQKHFKLYRLLYFTYKSIQDDQEIKLIKAFLKPGMTVIDIGANVGFYTTKCAGLIGESGKVYGFEPNPENFERLRQVCSNYRNIKLKKLALGEKPGSVTLFLSPNVNVDHLTYDNGEGRQKIKVRQTNLDSIFTGSVDFIKIDIQGYDYFALLGAKNLIARSPDIKILAEFWPYGLAKSGIKPEKFLSLFKKLGLKYDFLNHDDSVGWRARIKDRNFYCNLWACRQG